MEEVDLAFEMDDGYYGVKSKEIFQVTDKKGKIIGYVEYVLFSYTEGDDEEAEVLYLASGVKISGPRDY